MISPSAESKMRSSDRVLVLEIIPGKKPLDSQGAIDSRLFKNGEDGNQLHAVMDPDTCLWSFKYEKGMIPGGLKGNFTGFKALKKHAENYFIHRNIKITEVKD